MLLGMLNEAVKSEGTFGVAGVGPTRCVVNTLTPSAQIETSHSASKVPGTQTPHCAQKFIDTSPRSVVGPFTFQTKFGSTLLRSILWLSAEVACQTAAGAVDCGPSVFMNGPPQPATSAGDCPEQGTPPPLSSMFP